MNKRPIEQAQDADLRLSMVALQRAALRAHRVAKETGTAVVISCDGVLHHLSPASLALAPMPVPVPDLPGLPPHSLTDPVMPET